MSARWRPCSPPRGRRRSGRTSRRRTRRSPRPSRSVGWCAQSGNHCLPRTFVFCLALNNSIELASSTPFISSRKRTLNTRSGRCSRFPLFVAAHGRRCASSPIRASIPTLNCPFTPFTPSQARRTDAAAGPSNAAAGPSNAAAAGAGPSNLAAAPPSPMPPMPPLMPDEEHEDYSCFMSSSFNKDEVRGHATLAQRQFCLWQKPFLPVAEAVSPVAAALAQRRLGMWQKLFGLWQPLLRSGRWVCGRSFLACGRSRFACVRSLFACAHVTLL